MAKTFRVIRKVAYTVTVDTDDEDLARDAVEQWYQETDRLDEFEEIDTDFELDDSIEEFADIEIDEEGEEL